MESQAGRSVELRYYLTRVKSPIFVLFDRSLHISHIEGHKDRRLDSYFDFDIFHSFPLSVDSKVRFPQWSKICIC
jgi:hypothetical protein